jgi:hypothetical protein
MANLEVRSASPRAEPVTMPGGIQAGAEAKAKGLEQRAIGEPRHRGVGCRRCIAESGSELVQ